MPVKQALQPVPTVKVNLLLCRGRTKWTLLSPTSEQRRNLTDASGCKAEWWTFPQSSITV